VTSYPPIADYAIIGDCHTAALVSRQGSIDWYCPDRYDGPAVFCRLLDWAKGGYLSLAPAGDYSAHRQYRGPTNVLDTTFTAAGGRVRLTDLMPVHRRQESRRGYDVGRAHRLLRLVEGLDGTVDLELRFRPTFDYARSRASIAPCDGGAVADDGQCYLALACAGVGLEPDGDGGLRGRLRVRAGERRWIALTDTDDAASARAALAPGDFAGELARTLDYWQDWAKTCTYQGLYRDQVLRSVLTLKLLIYEPTGAVVAAPTTSLPEDLGGARNWDYRYTWLRDSTMILYALLTVGYREEAKDFFAWLERTCGNDPTRMPQIMYGIDGRRDLPEIALPNLDGYAGSRPVRIGNAAASQRQLDIFGEVLMAAYLNFRHEGTPGGRGERSADRDAHDAEPLAPDTWALLRGLVEQAAKHWPEPDRGIWEVRGGPQQFLYSKLMCWAALDRGIRLAEEGGLEAPLDDWRRTRDAIRQAILERGYDAKLGAFTQAFGSSALDASALAIPRIGFLAATDPRVRSTVERIRAALTRNGLVDRYHTADGLPGSEASFTLCTFWLVDALALVGRIDEARALYEHVVSYANDVGLLSEEIAPHAGLLLGNFPQGFTHLALVGSAVNLAKAAKHGAEDQPENEAQRAGRAKRAASEGQSAGAAR